MSNEGKYIRTRCAQSLVGDCNTDASHPKTPTSAFVVLMDGHRGT